MNTGFLGPAVATVLTVYGIETEQKKITLTILLRKVATVLTVYGIETLQSNSGLITSASVATVLTVYGIETQLPRMHYLI